MMPVLPPDKNPFNQETIYQELGLTPFADDDQMAADLEKLSEKLENLPEREKQKKMSAFQDAVVLLKNRVLRLKVNSLILDEIDDKSIARQVDKVRKTMGGELQLPPLDLSFVLMEGSRVELAVGDFKEISEDPAIEINLDEYKDYLDKNFRSANVLFEL